jgi:hypothetical protein
MNSLSIIYANLRKNIDLNENNIYIYDVKILIIMATFCINTLSGGMVELNLVKDRFHGDQLLMHVDQSGNLNSGDDDCTISLTNTEVKALIGMLNDYLTYTEGITHVLLASPLIHDAVTITVDQTKIESPENNASEPSTETQN